TAVTFNTPGAFTLRITVDDGLATNSAFISAIGNDIPVVHAGPSQTVRLPATATLAGTVSDSGLPFGTLTWQWMQLSGPGTATFSNASTLNSSVSFTITGTYVLRLTASDGFAQASDDLTATVL